MKPPIVVGLEHRPLDAVVDARSQEDRGAADRDVAPLAAGNHRPRPPDDTPGARDLAQRVDALRVELVAVQVGELMLDRDRPVEARLRARGRLPDAAAAVDAGEEPGDVAGGWHGDRRVAPDADEVADDEVWPVYAGEVARRQRVVRGHCSGRRRGRVAGGPLARQVADEA